MKLFKVISITGWIFFNCSTIIPQALITLNPNVQYQTMNGWPGMEIGLGECGGVQNYRDSLLYKAINEFGINRGGFDVKCGAENSQDYYAQYVNGTIDYTTWRSVRYSTINDNNDPDSINWDGFHFTELDAEIDSFIIPLKELYEATFKESLFINFTYIAFIGQNGTGMQFHHDDPEEYAEFILAAMLHMRTKYNLVPNTIELCLEPDWGGSGGGTKWTGQEIGQRILATAQKLEAAGFTPRFIVPSVSFIPNAMPSFNGIVQEIGGANVTKYIEEFCYHLYRIPTDAQRIAIADTVKKYNIKSSMLEASLNDGGGGTADALYKDLTMANVSAWKQFCIGYAGGDDGGAYYYFDTTDFKIHLSKYSKYFPQYFKFIKRGAIRIEAKSSDSNFEPVAFINKEGDYVVVVKTKSSATTSATISVSGLPAGIYGITYTTNSEINMQLADVSINTGDTVSATIPAAGVITIFRKTNTIIISNTSQPGIFKNGAYHLSVSSLLNSANITITYSLSKKNHTSIDVYSLLGKHMGNLFAGVCSPGVYTCMWDSSIASPGMYLVKMKVGNETTAVKKLIVKL